MSHVVLARKYRPRNFEQMVGQTHVVQALTNALTSGRLHHAYLFTGTRGIGKTTVSRILAKSLNCTGADGTGGVTAHPCGVCQACTEIDADRFIDYIELDAASNRSIDEIRDLIERAAYKPSVGRYKVFMIDEAHQLTKDAFNALLKTLEEPPEYLKFVLATTDPEKMLPTVLSRCLQFNLRPMAPETVQAHLAEVLHAEQVTADAGALRLLSRAARGSMRDALSLTDQAIAFGAGVLDEGGVRAMLGTVDRSHAQALVGALARRDGPSVLATMQALRELGLSAAGTLEEMAALLQQMAIEQAVPGALDASDPDTAGTRALSLQLPADETQLLYSIVVHGRAELNLLSDEYAALTMVVLRLLAFAPSGGRPTDSAAMAASTASDARATSPGAARASPLVAAPRDARATAPARPLASQPVSDTAAASVTAATATATAAKPVPHASPATPVTPGLPPPTLAPSAALVSPLAAAPAVAAARPTLVAQTDRATRYAAPAPAETFTAQEPPPWVDDALPDGDSQTAEVPATANPLDDRPEASVSPDRQRQATSAVRAPAQPLPPPQTRSAALCAEARPDVEQPPQARSAAVATTLAFERTALGDQWAALIRPLLAANAVTALARELALQAELIAVAANSDRPSGRCWTLRVERETLRAAAHSAKLTAALQAQLDEPVQLQIVAGTALDSVSKRDTLTREATQRAAEQTVQNDPMVRELMAQFRTARIVPGSIQPVAASSAAASELRNPTP